MSPARCAASPLATSAAAESELLPPLSSPPPPDNKRIATTPTTTTAAATMSAIFVRLFNRTGGRRGLLDEPLRGDPLRGVPTSVIEIPAPMRPLRRAHHRTRGRSLSLIGLRYARFVAITGSRYWSSPPT